MFLFRNNQLPLNNRINAFDDTVDPRCTFCRIIDNNTASRDGLSHVFRTCIVTDRLIAQLITKLEPIPDPNSIDSKHCIRVKYFVFLENAAYYIKQL